MDELKIAIIGAGPAGTCLGRILYLNAIPFTIFEGELGLDVRSQGGTLDLHTKTGIAAMKRADLYDQFLKYARYDGEALTIADKNFLRYIHMSGTKDSKSTRGRPEIDRPRLRQILLESLPNGCIRWGKRLSHVDETLRMHFQDGTMEDGYDLIVGADGAWSKVRPLLTSEVPFYSGITGYITCIPDAEQNAPEACKMVNRGSVFTFSDHKSITAQQMGDGSLVCAAWYLDKELPGTKYDASEVPALKRQINERFKDWSPKLIDVILKGDENQFGSRSLYMLPVGSKWKHRPGVTLVGDAAHLMTPFAGEGVNLALADTMALADAIRGAKDEITAIGETDRAERRDLVSQRVAEFEKDMFIRGTKVQQLTLDMMNLMYNTNGAPRKSIEKYILRAISDEIPGWLYPLVAIGVYTWFFGFKLVH